MAITLFKKKERFFNRQIEPMCAYCESGKRSSDGTRINCSIKGPVNLDHSCNSFKYSPLKRVPEKQVHIPGNFDESGAVTGLPEEESAAPVTLR